VSPHDSEQTLDLEQILAILRRRAPVIVLCLALVTASAFAFSKHQTKKYTATSSLVFNNAQISQQVAGLQASGSSEPKVQQSTNVKLLELGATPSQTAQKLGMGLTAKQVKSSLEISAQGESNVVDVAATWTSPTVAAQIANTYASQFVSDQLTANHKYFASAQALVEKQLAALSPQQRVGPQGLALQDRAQSLAILSEIQSGNVQVAQAATVPTSPSSPKVARNTILGAVLGLLLGLGLAFLFERLDRRIREPRDLERIYGLPLLGVVPDSTVLSQHSDNPEAARLALPDSELETFRLLRAHLRYFNVDRELRTLVVASAAPGDGKTTVARNLAEAAATMGSRVLLIETDLRRPTLAKQLPVTPTLGLAGVLIGAVPLSEAIQTVALEAPGDGRERPAGSREPTAHSHDVLIAGAQPPNPAELIESQAMKDVLADVRSRYDLVLIDTPPLTVVSDAFPLLSQVDGVIIVGRVGRNRRDVAARLHEILKGVDAPLLGVVANAFKPGRLGSYGYTYGYYGYGYQSEEPAGASPNGAGASAAQAALRMEQPDVPVDRGDGKGG
jgi:Mrp family chromosome partitioning ATPase/capsular polysaccharide biosynthesis protein